MFNLINIFIICIRKLCISERQFNVITINLLQQILDINNENKQIRIFLFILVNNNNIFIKNFINYFNLYKFRLIKNLEYYHQILIKSFL